MSTLAFDVNAFNDAIFHARRKRDMTLKEVADELNALLPDGEIPIHLNTVSRWERDRFPVRAARLSAVCRWIGTHPNYFRTRKECPSSTAYHLL